MPQLLHLGAIIAGTGATEREVNRILGGMDSSSCQLKRFWTSHVDYNAKMLVVMGTVLGNAVSGSEAIRLTPKQATNN